MSENFFAGKIAVVTGAGGLLCSAIAKDLAKKGCKVVLIGRTLEKLQKVEQEILAAGGVCMCAPADVTDEAAITAIGERVEKEWGLCSFLINGAGMEGYLEGVFEAFPALPVVDASTGVALLEDCSEGEDDHDDHGHDHDHAFNAHIWLDAQNAIIMVNNLAEGLIVALPAQAELIAANRDDYIARLTTLDAEIEAALTGVAQKDIITFHEAFPYFANAYGLNVAAVINRDPDDALSPRALAELCKLVKSLGVPPLFVEPQYEDMAAQTIARETGAAIHSLDPIVTGPEKDLPLTYYEDVMRQNLAVLLTALGE